jgi:hypothetical protein
MSFNIQNDFSKPLLVEPTTKHFLNETLKKCREFKNRYNNFIFNLSLTVFFVVVLGSVLYFKYKGKPSIKDIKKRENDKYQYILSKIKNFQDARRIASQDLITSLPGWQNEYDVIKQDFSSKVNPLYNYA